MADRGKDMDLLDGTRLGPGACVYVRQQEPLGLGHAIWCAREIVLRFALGELWFLLRTEL